MPNRSREELEQIYKDLVEFAKVCDELHALGELWPTPMNGKSWSEEKATFYDAGHKAYQSLIDERKVKSCEVKTLCKVSVQKNREYESLEGFWHHIAVRYYSSSTFDFGGKELHLDDLIEDLEKLLKYKDVDEKIINSLLNEIGTSACTPRASLKIKDDEIFYSKVISAENQIKTMHNYRS